MILVLKINKKYHLTWYWCQNIRDNMVEKRIKKFGQGLPPFQAMPERNRFFSWEGFTDHQYDNCGKPLKIRSLDFLSWQYNLKLLLRLLTDEVGAKSQAISVLDQEKSALIRDLFQVLLIPLQHNNIYIICLYNYNYDIYFLSDVWNAVHEMFCQARARVRQAELGEAEATFMWQKISKEAAFPKQIMIYELHSPDGKYK